jgi:hypothetical protein
MNKGKSAASLCRMVVMRFPDMLCEFYFVKNCKIINNPATTEVKEIFAQIWNP